jgi:hypothetical protein
MIAMMTITMRQGDDFYVGNIQVLMTKLINGRVFTLLCQGHSYSPSVDGWLQILPGVLVQAGNSKSKEARAAKVRIQLSDRDIRVLRGAKWRQLNQKV